MPTVDDRKPSAADAGMQESSNCLEANTSHLPDLGPARHRVLAYRAAMSWIFKPRTVARLPVGRAVASSPQRRLKRSEYALVLRLSDVEP